MKQEHYNIEDQPLIKLHFSSLKMQKGNSIVCKQQPIDQFLEGFSLQVLNSMKVEIGRKLEYICATKLIYSHCMKSFCVLILLMVKQLSWKVFLAGVTNSNNFRVYIKKRQSFQDRPRFSNFEEMLEVLLSSFLFNLWKKKHLLNKNVSDCADRI